MIKKNVVLSAKNPCRNGVKIEMEVTVFAANFVELVKPGNAVI